MSRWCHGSGCICDELLAYKRKYNVKKGQIIEGEQEEETAFYCNNYVAKAIDSEFERGECVVTAYKLNPSYAAEELREMQLKDVDIKPVITAYEMNSDERPNWNSISKHSCTTKASFAEWNRLTILNGVLYRIWESANGVNICYQVIAPREFQLWLFSKVHDTKIAAHMGWRKTMHALLHFCYWHKMANDVAFGYRHVICVRRGNQHSQLQNRRWKWT